MEINLTIIITVSIVTTIFFVIFRKQIIPLFSKVKSIGPSGISLDLAGQKSKPEVDPKAEAEALMRQLDSVLVRQLEDNIKMEFGKKNLLGAEGVPVLIRYLAALSIAYNFSEIYRIIFGSQLSLLDYLNTQHPQPIEALRPFYNSVASVYPFYKEYSFEQWLGYLKSQLLIRDDSGSISITVKGREFLAFLTQLGLTRNKIG